MSSLNVGAFVNGERPQSKKALREALEADPYTVTFDPTSPFNDEYGTVVAGADLGYTLQSKKLAVVGPDPFVKRNWYATVELKIVKGETRVVVS
jgi:hypothetical protein